VVGRWRERGDRGPRRHGGAAGSGQPRSVTTTFVRRTVRLDRPRSVLS
jgi:hypothetical protein